MSFVKIGVLTSSYANNGTFGCNYGAALQGYALIKQLRLLGHDAHDINYLSARTYVPQQYSFLKRTLRRIPYLFNFKNLKNKYLQYKNKKNIYILKQAFIEFINDFKLIYNEGEFFTFKQLTEASKDFDAFIVGSDVVWNPYSYNKKNDEGFFLDFVDTHAKRVAYAPSFGVSTLPDESIRTLKYYLSKFDALSVREKSGMQIIKDTAGLDVPVVLDPTLLLDPSEYDDIIRVPDNLPAQYIAAYKFGNIEDTDEKIKEISRRLKIPVVYIPAAFSMPHNARYDLGPREFLGVIRNAELVLSDSFHCTVFALINHRPFLTFYRTVPEPGKDINSRMTDILKTVEMSDRLIKPSDEIKYDKLFDLNFDNADKIIDRMRKESLKYLKNALEVEWT